MDHTTLNSRMPVAEYERHVKLAGRAGMTPSRWAREALLEKAEREGGMLDALLADAVADASKTATFAIHTACGEDGIVEIVHEEPHTTDPFGRARAAGSPMTDLADVVLFADGDRCMLELRGRPGDDLEGARVFVAALPTEVDMTIKVNLTDLAVQP